MRQTMNFVSLEFRMQVQEPLLWTLAFIKFWHCWLSNCFWMSDIKISMIFPHLILHLKVLTTAVKFQNKLAEVMGNPTSVIHGNNIMSTIMEGAAWNIFENLRGQQKLKVHGEGGKTFWVILPQIGISKLQNDCVIGGGLLHIRR